MTIADACVFCGIVDGDQNEQIFFSDDHVVALLDIAPATRGHALVIPRRHAADVFDSSVDQFAHIMRGVWSVARILERELAPQGLTVIQSNGAAAWQDVFHLHVHLIPRYEDDALVRPWRHMESIEEGRDIRALTADLRGASGFDRSSSSQPAQNVPGRAGSS